MSMSESERRLLLSGTLDTSGVHAGEHAFLPEVASAWEADVEPVVQDEYGPEPEIPGWPGTPDGSEHRETPQAPTPEPGQVVLGKPEPAPAAPVAVQPKPAARKRIPAKKTTAPKE
jgi:hypothetical protein